MAATKRPTFAHRVQYGLLRLAEMTFSRLPVHVVFRMGSGVAQLIYHFSKKQRELVSRSISIAYGTEKSPEEIAELTKRVFSYNGGNLFTSSVFPFYEVEKIREHVAVIGREILEEAIAQKRGVVLLVPHMGNWELLAQAAGLYGAGLKIATHYRPLNNQLVNSLIEKRRQARGVKLFAKKTSSHQLTSYLRENGVLSILADQRIPSRGTLCSFFGRPTPCSPLPALLVKRTGAVMVGLHCRTVSEDQWEIHITRVEGDDSQACATNLAEAWKTSPKDVFWFQDRWKLPRKNPLASLAREPFPSVESITNPWRFKLGDSLASRPELPFPRYFYEWVEEDSDLVLERKHLDQMMP